MDASSPQPFSPCFPEEFARMMGPVHSLLSARARRLLLLYARKRPTADQVESAVQEFFRRAAGAPLCPALCCEHGLNGGLLRTLRAVCCDLAQQPQPNGSSVRRA